MIQQWSQYCTKVKHSEPEQYPKHKPKLSRTCPQREPAGIIGPHSLARLETPLEGATPRLEVLDANGSRHPAKVLSQTAAGLVRLGFDEVGRDGLYDRTTLEYEWIS